MNALQRLEDRLMVMILGKDHGIAFHGRAPRCPDCKSRKTYVETTRSETRHCKCRACGERFKAIGPPPE